MKVYNSINIKYKDKLAEKRRRVFVFKFLFFSGSFIAATGLIFYLLFFSGFFDIKNITLSGLDKVNNEEFGAKLNERINSKWLGFVEKQKNLVFFDADSFKAEVASNFPEIKSIAINKKLPNGLNINVTERETFGVWCFGPPDGGCKYFDEEGQMWGEAARSSGFLILTVDDLRPDIKEASLDLLSNFKVIIQHLKDKNILVNKFTIPEDYFGDFKAMTSKGYELFFSADSNIGKQLGTLDIFLAEKQKDTSLSGEFSPQYIDLRIDGRVYYK